MRKSSARNSMSIKIHGTVWCVFFILICLGWSCSPGAAGTDKEAAKNISLESELFLDVELLEEAGFEHFKSNYFRMLINKDYTYILNRKDSMLARFNREKPDRVYKKYGQGPSEFLNPISLFPFNEESIAAFDNQKMKIFLFDPDLNLKEEISVPHAIRKIAKVNEKITAFGDFTDGIFAFFDKDFKIIDTFGQKNRRAPFKNLLPTFLYMGFLLNGEEIADTSWFHAGKICKVDIIDPGTKKIKISLEWKNPHPPTQKSIDRDENLYSIYYVGKHGKFYVVQNEFARNMESQSSYDLLVFREDGKLHSTIDFPYPILKTENNKMNENSRIYYLDDSGNILYLDLNLDESISR